MGDCDLNPLTRNVLATPSVRHGDPIHMCACVSVCVCVCVSFQAVLLETSRLNKSTSSTCPQRTLFNSFANMKASAHVKVIASKVRGLTQVGTVVLNAVLHDQPPSVGQPGSTCMSGCMDAEHTSQTALLLQMAVIILAACADENPRLQAVARLPNADHRQGTTESLPCTSGLGCFQGSLPRQ